MRLYAHNLCKIIGQSKCTRRMQQYRVLLFTSGLVCNESNQNEHLSANKDDNIRREVMEVRKIEELGPSSILKKSVWKSKKILVQTAERCSIGSHSEAPHLY